MNQLSKSRSYFKFPIFHLLREQPRTRALENTEFKNLEINRWNDACQP